MSYMLQSWHRCIRSLFFLGTLCGSLHLCWGGNGSLQTGYGLKSQAMGGVGIALANDAFAPALNPAMLYDVGNRVDVGLIWSRQAIHTELQGLSYNAAHEQVGHNFFRAASRPDLWWPQAAVSWKRGDAQAIGLATYVYGEWRARFCNQLRTFNAEGEIETPRCLNSDYLQIALQPSWAWRFHPCHTVGVSALLIHGSFRATPAALFNAGESRDPSAFSNRGTDNQWGAGVRLGWVGRVCPFLSLGLTYQSKIWMSFFRRYRGLIPAGGDARLPSQFGIGMAFHPISRVVIAADIVKVFWRQSRFFHNETHHSSFGSDSGPGLGWNDQLLIKIGCAWQIIPNITLRVGFNHGNAPVPRGNPLDLLAPMVFQDHISAGLSYRWDCSELSVLFLRGIRHRVNGPIVNTDATEIITGDYPEYKMWLRGYHTCAGLEWGYRF